MTTETARRVKDNVILGLWMILLAAAFSFLFERQAYMLNTQYNSDLPAFIEAAEKGGTGSALLFVIGKLLAWTGGFKYAVGLLEGFMVSFTWMFATLFIEKKFRMKRWAAMLISLLLLHLTNIPAPSFGRYFAGSIIAQPWHNIAYNAMRMFAVPTMFFFASLYTDCVEEEEIEWKQWLLTCVMLFLSTLMKAGFFMAFAAALLIVLLVNLVTKKISLKNAFLLGLVALPSAALVIVQYVRLRAGDPEYRVIIGRSIFFFQEGKAAFFMKFATGLFFALMVFWYNRKKMGCAMKFVYVAYAVSLIEAMFLMETGDRLNDRNFMWGMHAFAFILYICVVPVFVGNLREYLKKRKRSMVRPVFYKTAYVLIGSLMLLAHAACGMQYYYYLQRGVDYFI